MFPRRSGYAVTGTGDWRTKFRPDIPSPARIYDYVLGGKDNFPADREAAEAILVHLPHAHKAARWNRAFLSRVVRYLVAEAGIRQFIDIGAGLPTRENVHEVAQRAAPGSRVVYVDNDPVVLAHGRDMLQGIRDTVIIGHDAREPGKILADEELRTLIDFGEPVAIMMLCLLHFVADKDDPAGIIRQLLAPFPSGSYLAISHATADSTPGLHEVNEIMEEATAQVHERSRARVQALLGGLDLVEPGLVWLPEWRPDPGTEPPDDPSEAFIYAAVARKP
jgi:hypothetical protein